ncbi:MAG TPA: glycosyltransferase [Candidatus Marinimicrobia bacterium]|nr:glycosyltransferase [Candidatus Neomarinimicrobiota bacterium]
MSHKKKLKLLIALVLVYMVILIGYKVYRIAYEKNYTALNADHIKQIKERLKGEDSFRFAVVGNIRNSMKIFNERILPLIRDNDIDFIISAGNAVFDGEEDKYWLLYRGMKKLGIPYVLTNGVNEVEDFGATKFYQHYGPYFFSFQLKTAYFIFLDSSGNTSWKWQMQWLRKELIQAENYPHRFVILCHTLTPIPGFDADDSDYLLEKSVSLNLQQLFSQYHVTAVFSAGYPTYYNTVIQGVRYINSGGGGGLLPMRGNEHYQFVKVEVDQNQTTDKNIVVPYQQSPLRYKLETLGLFLHSLFFMSLFNFLVILGVIGLITLKIYALIIRQEYLYRDFSIDEGALSKSQLRIAMFTNNYLPFIGGVPLSIDRLLRGLIQHGSVVKVFAPTFQHRSYDSRDDSVFRCPILFRAHLDDFPIVNIFSRKIDEAFKTFNGDLVHVHHPFWLGRKGIRLAKKNGIPVVFTYHTRLEYYTHYFPIPCAAFKNLAAHFLIKRFANQCDAIITPTASTEEYLRNLGVSALIETIPTGINFGNYKQWSHQDVQTLRHQFVAPNERLLISVSRMVKEKNIDFLIDGLVKVKNRTQTPFKCLLIGDGPEKERLTIKVAQLGMSNRIIFTGEMQPDKVSRYYLSADLFVFASTSETQGMVLLEAMAGGCPVVAVQSSGIYDVIQDNYNGFKVPESTVSWAEAVANLLEDDQRLSVLSQNSLKFAQNYSMEKIADNVLKLYQRVVILAKSKKN